MLPSSRGNPDARPPRAEQPAGPVFLDRPKRSFGFLVVTAAIVVGVLVAVVFRTGLAAPFVFDDIPRIVESQATLSHLWPADWLEDGQRPVVRFSLVLNNLAGGLDPSGYHAVNIAVHAGSAVLAMLVVLVAGRRLRERGIVSSGDRRLLLLSVIVALAWALHPVQTSTATYVIQRAESFVAFFSLAAILALLIGAGRSSTRGWPLAMIVFVVLALGSKPTAIVLPAILLLVDVAIVSGSWRRTLRDRWVVHAGAWASLLVLFLTGAVQALGGGRGMTSAGLGVPDATPLEYAVMQVGAAGHYLRLVIDPTAMGIDHGDAPLQARMIFVVGGVALLGLLAATLAGLLRGAWWMVVPGVLLLSMLPTSSVVPLADPVADHRIHLALLPLVVGVVAMVAGGVGRTPPRLRVPAATVALAVVPVILALEATAAERRIAFYVDPVLLWDEVAERRPDHVRGLVNRAAIALEDGRFEDAARDLDAARLRQPTNPVVLVNLAILDLHRARPAEAMERLAVAESARGDDAVLHAARGDALRDLGRPCEAIESYERAIELRPGDVMAMLALGNAFSECGRLDDAAGVFALVATSSPDPVIVGSARFNEGNMRFIQERWAAAASAYAAALEADPNHPRAAAGLEEARFRGR